MNTALKFMEDIQTQIKKNTVFLDQEYRIPFNFIEKLKKKKLKQKQKNKKLIINNKNSSQIRELFLFLFITKVSYFFNLERAKSTLSNFALFSPKSISSASSRIFTVIKPFSPSERGLIPFSIQLRKC